MATPERNTARSRRERFEERFDAVVFEHRFTISVVFPLVGAVLLLSSAAGWLPPALSFNPALVLLGTLVMRLPLLAGLTPLLDRRATAGLVVLAGYAYGIEAVGVATGWPYGEFEYTVALGPMLGGVVPVGLPIFFLPLVLNSYLLCVLLLGSTARNRLVRLVVTISTVLAVDLVLDPAAVAIGFWSYGGGPYYGVPFSNYLGWVLSATVTVLVLDLAFEFDALRERLAGCAFMLDDLVSFVVLWGIVNAVAGNWVAVAIAACLGTGLVRTDRFDVPRSPSLPLGR